MPYNPSAWTQPTLSEQVAALENKLKAALASIQEQADIISAKNTRIQNLLADLKEIKKCIPAINKQTQALVEATRAQAETIEATDRQLAEARDKILELNEWNRNLRQQRDALGHLKAKFRAEHELRERIAQAFEVAAPWSNHCTISVTSGAAAAAIVRAVPLCVDPEPIWDIKCAVRLDPPRRVHQQCEAWNRSG